jgi:hypothetical protein
VARGSQMQCEKYVFCEKIVEYVDFFVKNNQFPSLMRHTCEQTGEGRGQHTWIHQGNSGTSASILASQHYSNGSVGYSVVLCLW